MAARPPHIVSSLVSDQEDAALVTKAFRFMGQRFVPDSYIFQQLVYDEIGLYHGSGEPFTLEPSFAGPIRAFPRGLDLASVLGSSLANEILAAEGDTDYEGYPERVAALQKEFSALPETQWTQNLYWNWLHTLRPLLAEKGAGYPTFMRGAAWAAKALNTFLGSWTELRHDTVLYTKQSYVGMTMRAPMPIETERLPAGYVEPELEVWARLLSLVRQTREGLLERDLLNDEFDAKFVMMQDLLQALYTISVDELEAQTLSEEQEAVISAIGRQLEAITTFSERIEEEISSEADERMAIVVDVHTDVNTGQVLQEGVGDPYTIYVVVPVGEQTFVAAGGVFTHYEFKHPMADRLTDEAWQGMPKPPLAPWLQEVIPQAAGD